MPAVTLSELCLLLPQPSSGKRKKVRDRYCEPRASTRFDCSGCLLLLAHLHVFPAEWRPIPAKRSQADSRRKLGRLLGVPGPRTGKSARSSFSAR